MFIKDFGKGKYEVIEKVKERGIGLGASLVLRTYKSKILVKENLLTEVTAWEKSQLQMMDNTMIPLSKKVVDVIVGDVDVPAFHVTDLDGLRAIKKLQGKSKALSTFTSIAQSNVGNLSGIRTDGGFLVHLIGKLKIASTDDIMSQPDENGMRWVLSEPDHQSSLTHILNKASDSNIGSKIKGEIYLAFDKSYKKLKLRYTNDRAINKVTLYNKDESEFTDIKKLYNLYEKEVIKILKKHQKQLNKHFGDPQPYTGNWYWNELVVDKIMIVDVLGYIADIYYWDDEAFEDDYNSPDGKQKRKEIEQAQKMFGNKIEITTEPKDINKWIHDRGGDAFF